MNAPDSTAAPRVDYQIAPSQYRHWSYSRPRAASRR
jgi:hypothetical protein